MLERYIQKLHVGWGTRLRAVAGKLDAGASTSLPGYRVLLFPQWLLYRPCAQCSQTLLCAANLRFASRFRAALVCRHEEATLKLMVQGVREGFAAVHALGFPVTPFSLKLLFTWLPQSFAVRYWRRYFASALGDYFFARHALFAFEEMSQLANDCRTLLEQSRVAGPALRQLYASIDSFAEVHGTEKTDRVDLKNNRS